MKMNVVWLLFPLQNQNERKVRDITSHDIFDQTVILDNQSLLPKGFGKADGPSHSDQVVALRHNLEG